MPRKLGTIAIACASQPTKHAQTKYAIQHTKSKTVVCQKQGPCSVGQLHKQTSLMLKPCHALDTHPPCIELRLWFKCTENATRRGGQIPGASSNSRDHFLCSIQLSCWVYHFLMAPFFGVAFRGNQSRNPAILEGSLKNTPGGCQWTAMSTCQLFSLDQLKRWRRHVKPSDIWSERISGSYACLMFSGPPPKKRKKRVAFLNQKRVPSKKI